MIKNRPYFLVLLPFWFFLLFFKFGAGLHYALLSTLGTRILPVWIVGLIIGGATLVEALLDVPAGFALDRFGYKRLLSIATGVSVLGGVALLCGLTPTTFFISLSLVTFGWLVFNPGINAYVLSVAPTKIAGRIVGFSHSMGAIGIVCSSALLAFVINWNSTRIGGAILALLLIAFIAILLAPKERASVHAEKKIKRHHYLIRRNFFSHILLSVRHLNPASTFLILQSLAGCLFYGAIWFTIPLLLSQSNGDSYLGVGLSMFDLAIVLLGAVFGKFAERGSYRTMVFIGLLLFAIAGLLLGFQLNLWFLVLGFIATAGDEMSLVSLWTWLDRLDSKHDEDGLISGAIVLFEDIGWTAGPVIAGLLYEKVGPGWTIATAAVPILLLWLLSLIVITTHRKTRESASRPRGL